jgi:hypothetical protein
MSRWLVVIFAGVLVAALAVACGGGGKSTTVKGPNGQSVKVTSGGKLPSDFPSDFPVYPGADYQGGAQTTQQGVNGFYATWQTGDSVDKVKSYYEGQFSSGPWKTTASVNTGGANSLAVQRKDDANSVGYVTITEVSGKTQIGVIVGKNPSSSGAPTSAATSAPSSQTPAGSGGSTPASGAALPAEVSLPSDYPSARAPLPSGARVTSASSVSANGQKSYILEFYTKDDPSTVIDGFKSELPKHNWTEVVTSNSNGTYLGSWADGSESVTVTAQQGDVSGYTKVSMLVAVKA